MYSLIFLIIFLTTHFINKITSLSIESIASSLWVNASSLRKNAINRKIIM